MKKFSKPMGNLTETDVENLQQQTKNQLGEFIIFSKERFFVHVVSNKFCWYKK